MTKEIAAELLKPYIDKCTEDGDPYFIVHFSIADDYFSGFENGLDFMDARIIVKQLRKQFPELEIMFQSITA